MLNTSAVQRSSLRELLATCGLTDQVIVEVVRRGETERDSATALDAPTRGGTVAYFERVRAIREVLVPLGWEIDNSRNLCAVVSPCGGHSVVLVSGDEHTGDHESEPQPKRPRGSATAVAVNSHQLDLFEVPATRPIALAPSGPATWFLLVNREPNASTVRVELSRPIAIDDGGRVPAWAERHCLDDIDLANPDSDDPSEDDGSIDVKVVRKP